MKFKCSCCEVKLGEFCPKVGSDGDFTGGPWYIDDNRLNHTAVICLHCGTIHDTVGSLTRALGFVLTCGNIMPMKIVGSMNPREIGIMLMSDKHYGVESARDIVVRELGFQA